MIRVVIEVETSELLGAENAAWHVVLDLANADLPRWVLAGGLMVHLHLYEAGATRHRVTTDVDAVVDVSVRTTRATEVFSRRLQDDLHMKMEPPNADNVGHRFTRDDGAIVAVLAADFGERARPHMTIPPTRTVEVPGGRGLLADAQQVRVIHDGRSGVVERPSLVAAIVGKARAFTEATVQVGDPDRHLRDAARLLTVVDPDAVTATRGQRTHLRRLLAEVEARPELADGDADLVIDTLTLLIDS
jgi:hypothetical protein